MKKVLSIAGSDCSGGAGIPVSYTHLFYSVLLNAHIDDVRHVIGQVEVAHRLTEKQKHRQYEHEGKRLEISG